MAIKGALRVSSDVGKRVAAFYRLPLPNKTALVGICSSETSLGDHSRAVRQRLRSRSVVNRAVVGLSGYNTNRSVASVVGPKTEAQVQAN